MKWKICFSGAYVPLTMEGNILVDGVLASCYASYFADHDVSDLIMAPYRWFPEIIEWIFSHENGYQAYVIVAEDLGRSIGI